MPELTLHKPSLRLAGFYLAVIVAISIFFSANVYQLSVQEFDRGFRGPGPGITVLGQSQLPDQIRLQIEAEREARYEEAKSRVLTRLIVINAIILAGGGMLSYYLARRTLQPIEEAHDAQSRFTADASHELRTPIAAMQTEIEVALMNPELTLAQAKDKLGSNLEELAKLTALSEGLLRLAQLENSDLLRDDVSVDSLATRAAERVRTAAEAKQMLVKVPEGATAMVTGDEDSLVEALVTILDNAIKYSPSKSQVTVRYATDRHSAVITIADKGIGIKATELAHIFERFYRADTTRTKQRVTGYGLGLAIAKNIIEAHKGHITVTSRPGKGTCFTVRLPLVP